MKIAILIPQIVGKGGASVSMLTLASYLAERNSVELFAHGESSQHEYVKELHSGSIKLPHQATTTVRFFEYNLRMKKSLLKFEPDIIFSQLGPSYLGHRVSEKIDVPHVLFLHEDHFIYNSFFKSRNDHMIGRILDYLSSPINRITVGRIIHNSDLLVANSRHTADLYRDCWDVEPAVVYPFVDIHQYRVDDTGEMVLHINPAEHKGIHTTIKIARENPQYEFLVVGEAETNEIENELDEIDNVEHPGYIEKMKDAYRRTKVVLMPSKREPFGRVPIEAGCSGIPTIASDKGGLPESVGTADLLVHSNNYQSYVERLEMVMGDYQLYSDLAKKNAEQKRAEKQIHNLRNLVHETIGVRIEL